MRSFGVAAAVIALLAASAVGTSALLTGCSADTASRAAASTAAAVSPKSSKRGAKKPVTTPSSKGSATSTAPPVPAPTPVADPAYDQAVAVLMYHHILPVPNNSIAITPAAFDAQMDYLRLHRFHPVSIAQLEAFVLTGKRLPDKPVLITFDDGRMNQITYGVPILRRHGFTATFFVVKKWVVGASHSFMHAAQLKELIADGFDVQSHTTNHAQIHPAQPKATGQLESYASMRSRYWGATYGMRVWMRQILGGPPVIALAYPGGRYNADAEQLAREAGYHLAFTTDSGYVRYGAKGQTPWTLPRWNTGAKGTTMATFAAIVNGAARAEGAATGH